jgi:integrase
MPRGACVLERERANVGRVWIVRCPVPSTDGETTIRSRTLRKRDGYTKTDAHALLKEMLAEVKRDGELRRKPAPAKFGDFAGDWIETYPQAANLRPTTINDYRKILRGHLIPSFGAMLLTDLTTRRVKEYVAALLRSGRKPNTARNHINLLHSIMEAAVEDKLISENPVSRACRPKVDQVDKPVLSAAEVFRVSAAFDELHGEAATDDERRWITLGQLAFLTFALLGIRLGELRGLRWRDVRFVDPDHPTPWISIERQQVRGHELAPKSPRGVRSLDLPPDLAHALATYRATSLYDGEDDFVFGHPLRGTVLNPQRTSDLFKAARLRAGITKPLRPHHSLRDTNLTLLARQLPAFTLQAHAGHASIMTTQGYVNRHAVKEASYAAALERSVFEPAGTNAGYNQPEPDPSSDAAAIADRLE